MSTFGLSYATHEEFEFRRQIFANKDSFINEHNSKNGSFILGHNKFSTWTEAEYKRILGGRQGSQAKIVSLPLTNDDSVDWRSKNAVNPIKDQANCGSCWAFSGICAIEGAHAIKTGELVSMSEQQVMDCITDGVS